MPKRRYSRNVHTPMKTLECCRCHKPIRLDEYVAHLQTCKEKTA